MLDKKALQKKDKEAKRLLNGLRDKIEAEVEFIDVKPYSHNIVSLCLRAIAERFGIKEANEAIEDFGLEDYGWEKEDEQSITIEKEAKEGS